MALSMQTKPAAGQRPLNRPDKPAWGEGINGGNPWLRSQGPGSNTPSTGIFSPQAGSGGSNIFQMLFGGTSLSGGQQAAPQGNTSKPASSGMSGMNPWSYLGSGAIGTSNPTTPGSWVSPGSTNIGMVAANGNWQNAQTLNHLTNNRGGQIANSDYGGSSGGPGLTQDPNDAMANAWKILGTGAVQSSNPVTPGSWHNGGIGSASAAGALGAWQNAQTLQHLSNYRGPQMAINDYAPGGAMYKPPAGGAAQGGNGSGSPNGSAGGNPITGNGQGIAPIYSTIDGNRPIYDDGQTQRNINQQVSQLRSKGSMRSNTKKLARPGMSLDAGAAAAAAPMAGAAQADALAAQASGGLQDELANQTYQLSGQEARGDEVLRMAELLRRLQQTSDYETSAYTSSIMGPLIQMLMGS